MENEITNTKHIGSISHIKKLLDQMLSESHPTTSNVNLKNAITLDDQNFEFRKFDHLKSMTDIAIDSNTHNNQSNPDNQLNILTNQFPSILPEGTFDNYVANKLFKLQKDIDNKNNIHSYFPADIYIEGNEQHSYWYLYSVITSVSDIGEAPFRNLKSHGLVEDFKGEKMSKSQNNSLDPLNIIDGNIKQSGERQFGYGTDTLRLWICSKDTDVNHRIFEEELEIHKADLKLIRRVAKNCLAYLNDFQVDKFIDYERVKDMDLYFDDLGIFEQILLSQFIRLSTAIKEDIKNLNLQSVHKRVMAFIKDIFTNLYLESARYKVIHLPTNSVERRQIQYVLNEVIFR